MRFVKMHGCGNDYVYVDGAKERPRDAAQAARIVSDRHFGVGSDGLILINPSETADFEMEMYNADGSRGEMCGNGIRCVGKFVYDRGMTTKKTVKIETLAGIKTLELTTGEDGRVTAARVDMGAPVLEPSRIPVLLPDSGAPQNKAVDAGASEAPVVAFPCVIGGASYAITCVSMGNPHCVVFLDEDVRELDLPRIGPDFENSAIFPERVNTEFINVLDRTHLRMRVWERGSGETLACGTGACAAAVAAALNGLSERTVTVSLTGGDLHIEWNQECGHVFMTGAAAEVFEGEIDV